MGVFAVAELNMYESLTLIQLCNGFTDPKQRQDAMDRISQNQTQLKKWADGCPDNFLHKYWPSPL